MGDRFAVLGADISSIRLKSKAEANNAQHCRLLAMSSIGASRDIDASRVNSAFLQRRQGCFIGDSRFAIGRGGLARRVSSRLPRPRVSPDADMLLSAFAPPAYSRHAVPRLRAFRGGGDLPMSSAAAILPRARDYGLLRRAANARHHASACSSSAWRPPHHHQPRIRARLSGWRFHDLAGREADYRRYGLGRSTRLSDENMIGQRPPADEAVDNSRTTALSRR